MAEFGRVDVLVNNAGIGTAVPATKETVEQFAQVIDVNLNGCYWMAQACGKVMQPGSSIVNISSVLGLTTARLPQAAYARQQGGPARAHPRPGAAVGDPQGHPGERDRAGVLRHRDDRPVRAGLHRADDGAVPMGRTGDPEELAAAAVFLACEAGAYVTGQTLPVDGGLTIA